MKIFNKGLFINYLSIMSLCVGQIIDTIEFIQDNKIIARIDIPQISHNEMLKHIFRIVDMDSNDYLQYSEMEAFQRLTHPNIPLSINIWKQICNFMGINPFIGLTREDLNQSYTIYKYELGTNIEHDYKILKRKQYYI